MSLPTFLPRPILIPSLLAAVLLGLAPPAVAAESDGPQDHLAESIDGGPELAGDLSRPEVPDQQSLAGPRAAYSVVDLGQGYSSNASGVNEDGHVSGTLFTTEGDLPVVWRGDQVVRLDRGDSRQVRAMAIADDGTVGGWEYDAEEGKRFAVTWTRDEEGEYGDLQRVSEVRRSEGSLHGGEVKALGANGLVHVTQPQQHVPVGSDLVWQAGAVTELAPPTDPGPYLATNDMNDHGQVAGMAGNGSDDIQAFVWDGGSPSALPEPMPNAHITRGLAINDDGDVVGDSREIWYDADSAETIKREAGLWRDGAWTDLGNLYGDETTAVTNLVPWDVNNRDEVVGTAGVSVDGRGTDHAFVWRNGEVIDLAYQIAAETGWELNSAHSINERGQIVGLGTLGGVQRAFLLDPTRPLLFVPGMGASLLRSFDDQANPKDLWLACGEDRMQLSLFKEDDEISADDVRAVDVTRFLECRGLSGRDVDDLDAYGTMLEKLRTTYGYREYDVDGRAERRTVDGCDLTQRNDSPNLFVFAYDWRLDNAKSARELADYIGCIQQFYPGVGIDVAAHSMGSLVTRRYVLDHRRDTGLHKIVTIGAPWLGAPKLVDVLNTGNFASYVAQGSRDTIRHVVGGFAAAHQLMAGPYYHAMAGSVFAEDGWDYDRDGNATEEYGWANLKEALDARWSASTPATTVEDFHTYGGSDGQADWSNDSSGEDYTVIYGIQAGRNTIGKVKAVGETFCTPGEFVCVTRQYFDQVMTQGDGTVPTTSANRTSADDDLNGPAKLVPVTVHDSDDNGTVEHTALTRNPKVLKTMIDTFRGVTDRTATLGKDDVTEAPYRYVTVRGAQDIVLHDGQGRSDAPIDGEHRITLPGSQHLGQGPDGELVTMPADVGHPWMVTFTGSGKPASVKALEGTQERPEAAAQWRDLVVPEGHAAELLLTPTGLERLRIDTDGDGNVETIVPPTSDLSGEDALDTEPPTVALAEVTVDGENRYVVSATDGRSGTGVRRVLWSTDGERYTEYAAPVRAPLAATLFAFAEDHAGNRSSIVELDLFAASKAPVTTEALDPAPSASGWSAGATTVTLTAEAGAGSDVAEIRYRATGAQTIEEIAVTGNRAELRVTAPGRTTLWFQAVATDGATEPWRQKVLRIDAAAPTGRVLGPAPGSVVGVLGQISGTAADDAAGIHQVEVLLERTSDGSTWDGEAWSQDTTWLPARGTAEWRMTDVPGIDHLTPGAYAVRMRVTDGAERVTVSTAVTFTQAYAGRLAVTALGTVDGRIANTTATDVNDSGTAVGATGSIPMTGTRWTSGVAGDLQTPAGMGDGLAHAIAADGTAAGYAAVDSTGRSAVRWTAAGDPKVLPHLGGAQFSEAAGISTAGVVGQSGGKPVWWRDDATVVALPTLQPGQTGEAKDIDSAGTIVGYVVDADGSSHAVAWTGGGREVTDLGTLGGPYAAALGINDVGQVVGYSGRSTGGMRAFVVDVREGEAMTEVYVPTKRWARANDISDDGTIVGEYEMGDETRAAFQVTAAGVFQHLQLRLDPQTDWVLHQANAINGLGQIVGFGLKNGVGRAFLASTTHAPVAQDVVADTDEDTAVTVRLAATDPDPGARLTMELVLSPRYGTVSAISNGEIVYTPAPGFEGTDRFSYVANDGALRSNAAMVTVRVRPGADANQRPLAAVMAPATVPEGSTVEVDGSSSADADGTITAYDWDLDGDGAFDDATGPTARLTLSDQGLRPVALRVTDDKGADAVAGTTVEAVNVAPLVSLPPSVQVAPGEPVRLQGTIADPGSDSWTATVNIGDGTRPLALAGKAFTVETTYAAAGKNTVTVEVCDGTDCATATTTVVVRAAWSWEGFFAPVDNLPVVNTVKAGQAIPMKFSLGGDRGLAILAPGYPVSYSHDCGTGLALDAIEQTVTSGSSTLTYDAGTDQYQYVWKTEKSWANQCRTFTLKLADGSVHSAEFRLR